MTSPLTLSSLAQRYGFKLVLEDAPELRKDFLGEPGEAGDTDAQVCRGGIIAVRRDKESPKEIPWQRAYTVAHEIAEVRHGFRHIEEMWAHQSNILASWVMDLGVALDTVTKVLELERARKRGTFPAKRPRKKVSKKRKVRR